MSAIVVLAAPLAVTAFAVTGVPVGDAIDAIEPEPLAPDEPARVQDVDSGWRTAPVSYPDSGSPLATDISESRLAGSAQPSPARRAEPASERRGETLARPPARTPLEQPAGVPPAVSTGETGVGEPVPEEPVPAAPADADPVADPVPPPSELTP